jgi:hypothetical protein
MIPDRLLDPHGEERGNAARLEPRGHGMRGDDSTQAEYALKQASCEERIQHPLQMPVILRSSSLSCSLTAARAAERRDLDAQIAFVSSLPLPAPATYGKHQEGIRWAA